MMTTMESLFNDENPVYSVDHDYATTWLEVEICWKNRGTSK